MFTRLDTTTRGWIGTAHARVSARFRPARALALLALLAVSACASGEGDTTGGFTSLSSPGSSNVTQTSAATMTTAGTSDATAPQRKASTSRECA